MSRHTSRGRMGRTSQGGPRRGYDQARPWIYLDCDACGARKGYPCGRWEQARGAFSRYDEPTWLPRKRPHAARAGEAAGNEFRWGQYGPRPELRCLAASGAPCRDLRQPARVRKHAHPQRPRKEAS